MRGHSNVGFRAPSVPPLHPARPRPAHGSRRPGRPMMDEGWPATLPGRPTAITTPPTRKLCRGVKPMAANFVGPADSQTRPRRLARRTRSDPTTSDGDFPKANPLGRRAERAEFIGTAQAETFDRRRRASVTNRTRWESRGSGEPHRIPTTSDPGKRGRQMMPASSPIRRRSAVTNRTRWRFGESGEFHRLPAARGPGGPSPPADGIVVADPAPDRRDQTKPSGV